MYKLLAGKNARNYARAKYNIQTRKVRNRLRIGD